MSRTAYLSSKKKELFSNSLQYISNVINTIEQIFETRKHLKDMFEYNANKIIYCKNMNILYSNYYDYMKFLNEIAEYRHYDNVTNRFRGGRWFGKSEKEKEKIKLIRLLQDERENISKMIANDDLQSVQPRIKLVVNLLQEFRKNVLIPIKQKTTNCSISLPQPKSILKTVKTTKTAKTSPQSLASSLTILKNTEANKIIQDTASHTSMQSMSPSRPLRTSRTLRSLRTSRPLRTSRTLRTSQGVRFSEGGKKKKRVVKNNKKLSKSRKI